jgi:hypothetical protein
MHLFRALRGRHFGRYGLSVVVVTLGVGALLATEAGAALATLTPGHAYCDYFSTPRYGGMHLVASSPTVIGSGPSNYISGLNGTKQDTVYYVNCATGAGRIGGVAYVGLPRIVLTPLGSEYTFNKNFVIKGIRHLQTKSHVTMTVTMSISGTVGEGVINGKLKMTAPGCLPNGLSMSYSGS